MANQIHPLACVDSKAQLGDNIHVGPFCVIGPQVTVGNDCHLDSHVTLTGVTTIGERNRFSPNCVIGGDPQDNSFQDSNTWLRIGDDNTFREGVTVNRGAEKEDHGTRIGHGNLLMSNAHVAHNCCLGNKTILVNGSLLGGHVHVQDRAIISGNSAIHHFSTIGTLAFVGGCSRVTMDVPPFMLWSGTDKPEVRTINIVGMRRAGMNESTIASIKRVHRLMYREHKALDEVRDLLLNELDGIIPLEVNALLTFFELQAAGKAGRAREVFRKPATDHQESAGRQAA